MNAPLGDRPRIAVVLDDAAGAALPLEWSSALAQSLQRDLQVIYVESTSVLNAAALPITQALAHAGARWQAFGPRDVERGYRLEAERLRALLQQSSAHHTVRGSLEVVRGDLHQAAWQVGAAVDLVLVGGASAAALTARAVQRCRSVLVWVDDGGEETEQLVSLARRCAESLGATARIVRAELSAVNQGPGDLLVLPRARVSALVLARLRRPALLVGRGA